MAFTFDPIFAADPNNPTNVASNASIVISDPADPGNAPVTITDVTGSPLPNPVTVNKNGFGPAFQHATLDRLAWNGGGYSGYFTSYEGMKAEAVAARAAAETAGADAAAAASADLATAVADAEAAQAAAATSATAAANSANLVNAPADTAIAAAINGEGTATKAALSATTLTAIEEEVPVIGAEIFAPPTNVFADFLGRVRTGVRDVSIMIVSDSTVHGAGTWGRQFPAALAALFPTHNVSSRFWNDAITDYDAATVIAGTGPRTINVWGAAHSGKTWQYFTDITRKEKLLGTPNADLIIISNGHNENTTTAQAGNMGGLRGKAIVHIEQIREFAPSASTVILSQNPLLANNAASEHRADMYRRIAQERGYGFIDVCQAFHDDGRPLTDLVTGDGIHPTAAGYTLWLNYVMAHMKATRESQIIPGQRPAFHVAARNIAPNPAFTDFDGTNPPTGWTLTNCTTSKDTTNFETGTWALKLTKTAGGSTAYAQADLPLNLTKGQTVTIAARMRVATGVTSNAGQLSILHNSGSDASDIWALNDQYFWRSITYRIPTTATFARVRIMVDPSTGASAEISVDRVIVTLGDMPADLAS